MASILIRNHRGSFDSKCVECARDLHFSRVTKRHAADGGRNRFLCEDCAVAKAVVRLAKGGSKFMVPGKQYAWRSETGDAKKRIVERLGVCVPEVLTGQSNE